LATSFSGERSQSARREPPTMGKQLVSFITCVCESSAPQRFINIEDKDENLGSRFGQIQNVDLLNMVLCVLLNIEICVYWGVCGCGCANALCMMSLAMCIITNT
jgi:hypothetical protein